MREANWEDCLRKNSVRKRSPDMQRAKSLRDTAKERISLIKDINSKNCNFVFEDYYTSLIEILQALAFERGYNILNHVCIGFYLKDVLKKEELCYVFDDLRYKRNSLTYYGNKMDFDVAKEAIQKCKKLIRVLMKIR